MQDHQSRTDHAEKWGIAAGYHDIGGSWQALSDPTSARLLAAMGAAPGSEPAAEGALVIRASEGRRLPKSGEIVTESGDRIILAGFHPPARLPLGYHRILTRDGGELPLIVCPARCHLPARLHEFGLAVQLYAVRSGRSWGIGDLGDLASLASWASRDLRAEMLLLNPLHAPIPGIQDPSPYYPSSRLFRNPLYLRIEDVPGAESVPAVARLATRGRHLNSDRLIDHSAVYELKLQALRAIFRARDPGAELDAFAAGEGSRLADYATFCGLTEKYGRPWQRWPDGLRHPLSPAVRRFRRSNPRSIRFHQWLQFLLERQLDAAGTVIGLVNDLAIGVNPDGADAWMFQDVLARGISVGSPPDPFNAAGQDWGLPPFDPWKLRADGYHAYIETLRSAFRHAHGARIDHVMGMFRLFWIPAGEGPAAGGYVRYPARELLDILALESVRAAAYVVGEDLGTVEDSVRRELARRRVMSYRLLWFEERPPREYPELALAAVTTHDLPTVAGIWDGTDTDPQIHGRLQRVAGLEATASADEAVLGAHRALADAPCRILAATLDDLLSVPERPNLPGTTARTNWSLALPSTLEELAGDPRPARVAALLGRR